MGYGTWSDDDYHARATHRATTGAATFAYSNATASRPVDQRKAHPSLEPLGVKKRESRDSNDHPNSVAIGVGFDVTGSMLEVPKVFQKELAKLMSLVLTKSPIKDPQILIGAIGDAYSDRVPLQVGQFESGIEIENDLTNIYLEGGGGGQNMESYELFLYFMARHTSMDCLEKRGKKAYLFTFGDEKVYPQVDASQVKQFIGDDLQANITITELIAEVQRSFEYFHIMPNMTSHWGDSVITDQWKQLLGERFLLLDDPAGISQLIAATIGVCEGGSIEEVANDLRDAGTALATIDAVSKTLTPLSKVRGGGGLVATLPDSGAASGVTPA